MQKRVGELLVAAGAVAPADVERALAQQRARPGRRIGEILISAGCATPEAVGRALAEQFELPFIQLPEISSRVSALLPLEFQAQHRLVPFRLELDGRTERIHLALADPTRMEVVDELRFQINKPLTLYVAATDDVDGVLVALQGGDASVVIDEDDDVPASGPPPKTTPILAVASPPTAESSASAPADGSDIEIPVEWVVEKPAEAMPSREPPTLRVAIPISGPPPTESVAKAPPPPPPPPIAPLNVSSPESWASAFPPPPARAPAPPPAVAPKPVQPPPAAELPSIIVDIVETPEPVPPASMPSIAVRPPPAPSKPAPAAAPSAKAVLPPAKPPMAAPPTPKVEAPRAAATPVLAELKPAQPPPPPAPQPRADPDPPTPPVGTPLSISAPRFAEDSHEESWFDEPPKPLTTFATEAREPPGALALAPDVVALFDPETPPVAPGVASPKPSSPPGQIAAPAALPLAAAKAPVQLSPQPMPDVTPPVDGAKPQAANGNGKIEFSDSDLDVLEALEHLAAGEAPPKESEKVKPPQMVASLIRLLIRKGVIDEMEFLEELGRK
jgi:hypothetical protein